MMLLFDILKLFSFIILIKGRGNWQWQNWGMNTFVHILFLLVHSEPIAMKYFSLAYSWSNLGTKRKRRKFEQNLFACMMFAGC